MAVQPNVPGGPPGGTPKATMAYHHALADTLPSVGFRLLRIGSTVAAIPRSIVGALLPATRREGRVVGLVGVVIVLFIVAFTNLMLRELNDSSRTSAQEHVEQLTRAVTYQLGTTLFMVENVMDQASEAVKAHSNVRGVQLNSEHQVATNLLADFLLLDPDGQVMTAMTKAEALTNRDLSDRELLPRPCRKPQSRDPPQPADPWPPDRDRASPRVARRAHAERRLDRRPGGDDRHPRPRARVEGHRS